MSSETVGIAGRKSAGASMLEAVADFGNSNATYTDNEPTNARRFYVISSP